MKYMFYESPLGRLTILLQNGIIRNVKFGDHSTEDGMIDNPALSSNIFKAFDGYFSRQKKDFSIEFNPEGTDFQKTVWQALLEIPFGETASYLEVAQRIGKPKAVRAVGNACRSNPIPIIIPCHRVISKNGSLTGYAGGIENKKYLLELEKVNCQNSPPLF